MNLEGESLTIFLYEYEVTHTPTFLNIIKIKMVYLRFYRITLDDTLHYRLNRTEIKFKEKMHQEFWSNYWDATKETKEIEKK